MSPKTAEVTIKVADLEPVKLLLAQQAKRIADLHSLVWELSHFVERDGDWIGSDHNHGTETVLSPELSALLSEVTT